MKRLVGIIAVAVVALLTLGAAPVLAGANGPPHTINNHTATPGDVTVAVQSKGPPVYIAIHLPSQSNSTKGATVYICPTSSPAQ